jgi:hypothetical protein
MSTSTETGTPRPIRLDIAGVALNGNLSLPADAHGLVVFAHGSGSSRHSAGIALLLSRCSMRTWRRCCSIF